MFKIGLKSVRYIDFIKCLLVYSRTETALAFTESYNISYLLTSRGVLLYFEVAGRCWTSTCTEVIFQIIIQRISTEKQRNWK